jgi:hypothetical protein
MKEHNAMSLLPTTYPECHAPIVFTGAPQEIDVNNKLEFRFREGGFYNVSPASEV